MCAPRRVRPPSPNRAGSRRSVADPEPPAEESRHDAEIGDLDLAGGAPVELEVAGRRAVLVEDPRLDPWIAHPLGPLLVAPSKPIDPVPIAAGRGVEEPAELRRRVKRTANLDRLGRRRGGTQVSGGNDLKAPGRHVHEHTGSMPRPSITMVARCGCTAIRSHPGD